MKRRRCIGSVSRRVFQRLLQLEKPVLADAEIHPHRVARVKRREQRLLGGNQSARLHQRGAHEALARRAQGSKFQVQLHVPQERLLRLDQRGTGALLRHRRVVVLLADRLLRDQPRVACEILFRVDQISLGLGEARFGLRELSFEGPLIDDVEDVTLLHPSTVGKYLSFQQAGDLAADLDGVGRLRLRHILVENRHRTRLDLDHGDFRRGRLGLRVAFATAQDDQRNHERERPCGNEPESVSGGHGNPSPGSAEP